MKSTPFNDISEFIEINEFHRNAESNINIIASIVFTSNSIALTILTYNNLHLFIIIITLFFIIINVFFLNLCKIIIQKMYIFLNRQIEIVNRLKRQSHNVDHEKIDYTNLESFLVECSGVKKEESSHYLEKIQHTNSYKNLWGLGIGKLLIVLIMGFIIIWLSLLIFNFLQLLGIIDINVMFDTITYIC